MTNFMRGNVRRVAAAGCVGLVLTLAGCGGGEPAPVASTTTVKGPSTTRVLGAVRIVILPIGDILVNGSDLSLYMNKADTPAASACDAECEKTWAPFVATITPTSTSGLAAADFGTFTRADGTQQVTYKGHQLYHYRPDSSNGQIGGQGIADKWFLIGKDGQPIQK